MPTEHQAKLADWLLSGMPYHQAKELVQKEFDVAVSMTAFSGFWQSVCSVELLRRRSRAVNISNDVALEASKNPGRFDVATIDALKQKAFELAISPQADPANVKAVFALVLKARDQELDRDKLSLDLQRFRRETCELFLKWYGDKRASEVASGAETNSAKIEKLGQIMFGEEWAK